MPRTLTRDSVLVASRRLGAIGLLFVLTAGCSGDAADTPAASAMRADPVLAESDSAVSGDLREVTADDPPSEDADPSSASDAKSSATKTDAEVDTEVAPRVEQPSVPAEARPTFQDQPEPDLPADEIRETYADNPPPADSVETTLCNLTRAHLAQLSAAIRIEGSIDDQMLRVAALSLSDSLSVWEGMAWQYPDLVDDISTARNIYAHWEFAIGLHDTGDLAAAAGELQKADELIDGLPEAEELEVGC